MCRGDVVVDACLYAYTAPMAVCSYATIPEVGVNLVYLAHYKTVVASSIRLWMPARAPAFHSL
jgi:hypothetical protein